MRQAILIGLISLVLLIGDAKGEIAYVASNANRPMLQRHDLASGMYTIGNTLAGWRPDRTLIGMDFREQDKRLYGLATVAGSNVYELCRIDPQTDSVNWLAETATADIGFSWRSIDFDPVRDVLTVTSAQSKKFTIDPDSGSIASLVTPLHWTSDNVLTDGPWISAVAHAADGSLYGVELATGKLAAITEDGEVGQPLGNVYTSPDGFDISLATGQGYIVDNIGFWSVDVRTGEIDLIGVTGTSFVDLSIVPAIPEPASALAVTTGVVLSLSRRVRRMAPIVPANG